MKKQIKSKLYDYECPDCGWKASRGSFLLSPACSLCGSENLPIITEREIVKEIETHESYTEEDYARVRKITQDIIDGKPLEEIEGLDLGESSREAGLEPLFRLKRMVLRGTQRVEFFRIMSEPSCGEYMWCNPLADQSEHEYY